MCNGLDAISSGSVSTGTGFHFTAEFMYPAFKINKDFEWGMLETLT